MATRRWPHVWSNSLVSRLDFLVQKARATHRVLASLFRTGPASLQSRHGRRTLSTWLHRSKAGQAGTPISKCVSARLSVHMQWVKSRSCKPQRLPSTLASWSPPHRTTVSNPHINLVCSVAQGGFSCHQPNCKFNVDANSGHAFGILLAAAGALRPCGAPAPVN